MSEKQIRKQIKPSEFKKLYEEYGASYVAKEYGISRTSVWRLSKKLNLTGKVGRPRIVFEETEE